MIAMLRFFPTLVVLLACAGFVGGTGAAFAQVNCRPWLRAAEQEQARGNTLRSEEALRIYKECVRQTRRDMLHATDSASELMLGSDPQYLAPILWGTANPPGSTQVIIPGYQRPNLSPGRPPGWGGGQRQPPITGNPPTGNPPAGNPPCSGGCPSGARGGTHQGTSALSPGASKLYDRSAAMRRTSPSTTAAKQMAAGRTSPYGATAARSKAHSAFGPRAGGNLRSARPGQGGQIAKAARPNRPTSATARRAPVQARRPPQQQLRR